MNPIDETPYILYVDNDKNKYPLEVPNGYIKTDMIASGAVTSGKIANKAVGSAKLDDALNAEIDGKAEAQHVHNASDITSGELPISHGGTSANTAASALENLGAATAASVSALEQIVSTEYTNTLSDIATANSGFTVEDAVVMRFGYMYMVKFRIKGFGNSTSTDYTPVTLKEKFIPAFNVFSLHTSSSINYAYLSSTTGNLNVRFSSAVSSTTTSMNFEFVFLNVPTV